MSRTPTDHPALVTAIAQAKNTDVVLAVVDESLRRAAEARREREEREAEQRERDAREERVREYERREEQAAEELHDREQREARQVAQREEESRQLHQALLNGYRQQGRLDVEL
ncbi:MAG: hypothetical protein AB7G11_06555 [Phycisphaerales bacterium]